MWRGEKGRGAARGGERRGKRRREARTLRSETPPDPSR